VVPDISSLPADGLLGEKKHRDVEEESDESTEKLKLVGGLEHRLKRVTYRPTLVEGAPTLGGAVVHAVVVGVVHWLSTTTIRSGTIKLW